MDNEYDHLTIKPFPQINDTIARSRGCYVKSLSTIWYMGNNRKQIEEGQHMKKFLEELAGGFWFLVSLGGYFPVNQILSVCFGDKWDVVISFLLPFYGYIVWFMS